MYINKTDAFIKTNTSNMIYGKDAMYVFVSFIDIKLVIYSS